MCARAKAKLIVWDTALLWVDKYLNETRTELACGADERRLFLSRTGHALSPHALTALVRNYIDKAKICKPGSCHRFRHTVATLMLENGADIRFIQAMLGHVKLGTAQIYTQASINKMKQIQILIHPGKGKRSHEALLEAPEESEEALLEALAAENAED